MVSLAERDVNDWPPVNVVPAGMREPPVMPSMMRHRTRRSHRDRDRDCGSDGETGSGEIVERDAIGEGCDPALHPVDLHGLSRHVFHIHPHQERPGAAA